MTRLGRVFIFLNLFLIICFTDHLQARTERWDNWDNYAIEGQTCSNDYRGQQCAPGLACEYYQGRNGYGICRRVCYSDRDCTYDEFCSYRGYNIGVCMTDYDRPGYPNRRANEGERCSQSGYRYPQCKYGLQCLDRNGDGVGICSHGHHRDDHSNNWSTRRDTRM